MLSVWAYDHYAIPGSTALREIGIAALFFTLFAAGVYAVRPERPAIPRTYPYSGLVKELGNVEENKVRASNGPPCHRFMLAAQASEESPEEEA